MGRQLFVTPAMGDYLDGSGSPLDPALAGLIEDTGAAGELSAMMVPPEQARLLTMLTRLMSASLVLDIGTFTGVSALAFATGLAPGGRVITCDVTDQWLAVAEKRWEQAGVADRIEFRLGAAARTLRSLPPETGADLAFIDADKLNYATYYELLLERLRPGGVLLADNVLLDGYVLDPELAKERLLHRSAKALHDFNAALAADDRVEVTVLPVADGLTIARKK
ncbi:methyltransferase domain-containing protein [Actinomadura sp. KC06]|uniref:O-methyltransferase n=1 Tax=Actinomadura sp. KC06 TaxID=2530369 RepID=UPI001042E2DB|nr:class I SAM-dependent methyltransferase [Actinomadura sp. KC06]TDD33894.1 methyltransferase domain-containing protein [Actinomadura sp. KC06]